MNIEKLKSILTLNRYDAGIGIIWQFNDTTVIIRGMPITQYEIFEEAGVFYMHTENPITSNEDYIVEVLNDKHKPFKIVLTPRYSKRSPVLLERLA